MSTSTSHRAADRDAYRARADRSVVDEGEREEPLMLGGGGIGRLLTSMIGCNAWWRGGRPAPRRCGRAPGDEIRAAVAEGVDRGDVGRRLGSRCGASSRRPSTRATTPVADSTSSTRAGDVEVGLRVAVDQQGAEACVLASSHQDDAESEGVGRGPRLALTVDRASRHRPTRTPGCGAASRSPRAAESRPRATATLLARCWPPRRPGRARHGLDPPDRLSPSSDRYRAEPQLDGDGRGRRSSSPRRGVGAADRRPTDVPTSAADDLGRGSMSAGSPCRPRWRRSGTVDGRRSRPGGTAAPNRRRAEIHQQRSRQGTDRSAGAAVGAPCPSTGPGRISTRWTTTGRTRRACERCRRRVIGMPQCRHGPITPPVATGETMPARAGAELDEHRGSVADDDARPAESERVGGGEPSTSDRWPARCHQLACEGSGTIPPLWPGASRTVRTTTSNSSSTPSSIEL